MNVAWKCRRSVIASPTEREKETLNKGRNSKDEKKGAVAKALHGQQFPVSH